MAMSRRPTKHTVINSYELQAMLGRGQSAEVWAARVIEDIPGVDLEKGQCVALKLYTQFNLQQSDVVHIHREFEVAYNLQHPNVVRVYDLVLAPARANHNFLVMELVRGQTLKEFISNHDFLARERIIDLAEQLLGALAEIHAQGALHRDIKTSNIMVSGCENENLTAKLLDFGIVTSTLDNVEPQQTVFVGSKHSASLEQLRGKRLGHRSDIYSFGCVLYHAYMGEEMYADRTTAPDIAVAMIEKPMKAEAKVGADHALVDFINSCIEVEPDKRPSSAAGCLKILRELRNGERSIGEPSVEAKVLFSDPLTDLGEWSEHGQGRLVVATNPADSGRHCIKKEEHGDPNGGYRHIGKEIGRSWCLKVRVFSPWLADRRGPADRLSLENGSFDGYGVVVNHAEKTVGIERRARGSAMAVGEAVSVANIPESSWYEVQLTAMADGNLCAVLCHKGVKLAEVKAIDETVERFDRFSIRGGSPYYVADVVITAID